MADLEMASVPAAMAKPPPWPDPQVEGSHSPPLSSGSGLKFSEVVKKGLPTRPLRNIPISEEERARLASSFPDKVIIGRDLIQSNRKIWENAVIGKFLGPKISISFFTDKVLPSTLQKATIALSLRWSKTW